MSTYKFHIGNYHAVKKALIQLNGITVLAGVNGSGKSTIARWLHHTVKVLNDYDEMVEQECVMHIAHLISSLHRFSISMDKGRERAMRIYEISEMVSRSDCSSIADIKDSFTQVMGLVSNIMHENITDETDADSLQRYSTYFEVNRDECSSANDYIDKVITNLWDNYKRIIQECNDKKQARSFDDFCDKISEFQDEELDENQINLNVSEDNIDMINGETFKIPMNLRNVVYINTQFIGQSLSSYVPSELSKMLCKSRRGTSSNANIIIRHLQHIINGDVKLETQTPTIRSRFGQRYRYSFVRKNGQTFDLRGAATGEISFSYILQLLKNGWIDDGTLLIIDEPESHLHPQWIVNYARVLVQLNKLLGTKILISSHNPDMVNAIRTMAEVDGILDKTNFYLAKPEDDGRYIFTNEGNNIENIFDSFNIALERINQYGVSSK